jgi:nucleoside-diphosphate-sugar epimerase
MKILVLGGSYFLGKHFVYIARKEHDITVFNRGSRPLQLPQVSEIYGDRHNPASLSALAGQYFDAVVDFCAYNKNDISQIFQIPDMDFRQYIFVSTCDVYERGLGKMLDEQAPLETRDFGGEAGSYILGKAALEEELAECAQNNNAVYTSIRPAFIYGPDNYAPREGMYFHWIKESGQILHPTDASGEFQMVYVMDVAQAILHSIGNPEAYNQAFNLAPLPMITYDSFAEALKLSVDIPFEKADVTVGLVNEKNIPLPFPLTREESNWYDGRKALVLIGEYTSLADGLRKTFNPSSEQTGQDKDRADMNKYDKYINEVERLFEENKAKEVEKLLLDAVKEARETGDTAFELQMQNELIGYYRQTGEKERLLSVINEALEAAERMDLLNTQGGSIPYATTALNVANGYRSVGELKLSEKYYKIVQKIYLETLDENDMLIAGLYNNLSLLCQEMTDYQGAMEYLLKALDIAMNNQAGFEIAVTYANLANTAVAAANLQKNPDILAKAKEYACEAIRRFEKRNTIDAHYSAALSALGMCFYYEQQYQKAQELFQKGMDIVERSLGRNTQYMRLKENRDMCADKCMTGLKLSRLYYEQYGKPMLNEQFGEYKERIAAGLVGEGSDCYGYDDAFSMDHDWGPDFCLWLPDDLYEKIGEQLSAAYAALPQEFMGYHRKVTKQGSSRRGVMSISGFYAKFLNTEQYDKIDWHSVSDYSLSAASNGEVFEDAEGVFGSMREKLQKGYPEEILYLKLAEDLAKISQTGQYNYARMLKRGDRITADMMLSECIRQIMLLVHHMENKYPPHDKWLRRSFDSIALGTTPAELVRKLHSSFGMEDETALTFVSEVMEQVGEYFAKELYARDYISDIETYLDYHTDELLRKASYAVLSDEELAERIARTEFTAFDEVKNEGGRASCQNDWPTFSIMRKSQYLTWNRTMLLQYLYDFTREYELGHNLITEKYGRMMESTAPLQYKELKEHFEELSEQKKAVIEQIVALQMEMLESFGRQYPKTAGNARSFHTYEDNYMNTSYETYLRGEISTYSDKMLQLYGKFVVECAKNGRNIPKMTIQNTAKLYGYKDLETFEQDIK